MRITLVYHGRYWVRQALELETLAAVMRCSGHDVRLVYDPDVFGVSDNVLQIPRLARLLSSPGQIVDRIVAGRPDAVLFSVLPGSYAWSRQIAQELRTASSVPIVFVGLHPSLVPERVMCDTFVDVVIRGEAENVINPLLAAIGGCGPMEDIGNLSYRRDGAIVHTPMAPLVDLDALPLPDKDLFQLYVSHGLSYAAMVSRGCPYHCTFCEETCARNLYDARYYRRKSVATVMAELVAGKRRYHFREVTFKDSYLSGHKGWLAELMERYRREIGVPFKCFCTISGFDRETARLLKQGGCYSIEFGLQTWNSRIRREVLDRVETNEQAVEAFAACAAEKLWYDVDHMFNLPGETEQDHIEGAACYRGLCYLNRVKVHYLVYLPTAPIVEHGVASALLPADAPQRLAEGWESDFYDQAAGGVEQRRIVSAYAALYKLLPGLPDGVFRWLMRGGRVDRLRRIPGPAMALLQAVLALRSGDLRFLAYLGLYPAKILAAVVDRLGGMCTSRRSPRGTGAARFDGRGSSGEATHPHNIRADVRSA